MTHDFLEVWYAKLSLTVSSSYMPLSPLMFVSATSILLFRGATIKSKCPFHVSYYMYFGQFLQNKHGEIQVFFIFIFFIFCLDDFILTAR